MVSSKFSIYTLTVLLTNGAGSASATTILGGFEDIPGSSGYERNGDFNDVMFEMTGNFTMQNPGGVFNNLTSGVVNQNGTVFWDNPSADGPDLNIGYMFLNDPSFPGLEYLATPSGASVNDVTFYATGPVTLTYLGGITAWLTTDNLGWYSLAKPTTLDPLYAYPDQAGYSVTFDPNGAFALYAMNGQGQTYSSVAANNVNESGTQQHFAFFEEPGCVHVPEPSTASLAGIGMALLGLGVYRHRS